MQTIVFGILATVIAFAALIVGYFQLRSTIRHGDAEMALELITIGSDDRGSSDWPDRVDTAK